MRILARKMLISAAICALLGLALYEVEYRRMTKYYELHH
jgi:hypothetical protein